MAPVVEEQKIEMHHIICVSGQLDPNQSITDPSAIGSRSIGDIFGDSEF